MALLDDTRISGETSGASAGQWARRVGQIKPATWLVIAFMLLLPMFSSDFVLYQIFGWALILGMIALSLMFLAGYGGMVRWFR